MEKTCGSIVGSSLSDKRIPWHVQSTVYILWHIAALLLFSLHLGIRNLCGLQSPVQLWDSGVRDGVGA